jgi:hypothetical protein
VIGGGVSAGGLLRRRRGCCGRWRRLRRRRRCLRHCQSVRDQAEQAAQAHPSPTAHLIGPEHVVAGWSLVGGRSGRVVRLRSANDQRPTTNDCSKKNRRNRPTLMVPEKGRERQSRRIIYRLRKCACQEDGSILRPCTSRTHQEYDILSALQRRLDLRKVIRIIYRLLVHFEDHVAAIQTKILGK